MSIRTPITSLEISDGNNVSVPDGGIIAFVGPNNAGKSAALRDIRGHISTPYHPSLVVKAVQLDQLGTMEQAKMWVEQNCHKTYSGGRYVYHRMGDGGHDLETFASMWSLGPPYSSFGELLIFFAGGEGRLSAANGTTNIDFALEAPVHPLHYLYQNPDLEERVSDICMRAFGVPLTLNRFSGSMVYLHVGTTPIETTTVPLSSEYMDALRALPRLDEQGDGMKSFMGLLLNLTTSTYPFVIVDEPEAFLHPPQARLLGKMLGDEKSEEAQVFVATHDSDVLRGLLDSSSSNLTVVRLVRDGEVNRASQLESDKVSDLWKDPLLRYSNVLDGLFHDGVILCEGDADCRFYQSVLDADEQGEDESRRPDLLWTHCGGKARMPMVIGALRAVDVPVRVIADFDVLREEQPLRRIVEVLGGDWSAVQGDWTVVKSALDSDAKAPSTGYVREQVEQVLSEVETPTLSKEDSTHIRQLVRPDSGWDRAKRGGKAEIPQGDASARVERLLDTLRNLGLFVVEVGELERFAPTVPRHGPAWVSAVHEQGLHANGSLPEARTFVNAVVASF